MRSRLGVTLFGTAVLGLCMVTMLGAAAPEKTAPVEMPVMTEAPVAVPPAPPAVEGEQPLIQMAILLDTSGSMNGLINQARTQLWDVVSTFATARRDGQLPELQVALYEYGNSRLSAESEWVVQVLPLTTDLDAVSEKLFAMTTNGGTECCGAVIKSATDGLQWSADKDVLKVIFIAGNEPFTQGKVDYKVACKTAIEKGIQINTIYCGGGEQADWKDGALLADGVYANLDQNKTIISIAAPQDAEIAKLNVAINDTYIGYGTRGVAGKANQVAQDANMANGQAGPGGAEATTTNAARAAMKASGLYNNAAWDLVDAVRTNAVKLEEVKAEDLPEHMRAMTLEEKKAYLDAQWTLREETRRQITTLVAARNQFISDEMKKRAIETGTSLSQVMTTAAQSAAEKKGFEFAKPQEAPPAGEPKAE